MKSDRNKTIQLTDEEKKIYSSRLYSAETYNDCVGKTNITINSNLFNVINLIPNECADLIIIDPPYNLTKNFNGTTFQKINNKEYYDYVKSWFALVVLKLKKNGSMYLCGDWKCTSVLYDVMSEYLTVMNRITWQREKGRGAQRNWKNGMEDIWFGVNGNEYYFDVESVKLKKKVIAPYRQDGVPKDWVETDDGKFRLTYPSNFMDDITIPYWSMAENTEHPTQKPEKLIAKLILASCPENGVVLDPFLGSGTTSVVAKKLNRQYIGIEMNEEYAAIAEKRLETVNINKSIQGYENGIFLERNTKK